MGNKPSPYETRFIYRDETQNASANNVSSFASVIAKRALIVLFGSLIVFLPYFVLSFLKINTLLTLKKNKNIGCTHLLVKVRF